MIIKNHGNETLSNWFQRRGKYLMVPDIRDYTSSEWYRENYDDLDLAEWYDECWFYHLYVNLNQPIIPYYDDSRFVREEVEYV